MELAVDGVVNRGVSREKSLSRAGRLEVAASFAHGVEPAVGSFRHDCWRGATVVVAGEPELPTRTAGLGEFVRHHHGRGEALLVEELPPQTERGLRVMPSLDENVEQLAFTVDGSPET